MKETGQESEEPSLLQNPLDFLLHLGLGREKRETWITSIVADYVHGHLESRDSIIHCHGRIHGEHLQFTSAPISAARLVIAIVSQVDSQPVPAIILREGGCSALRPLRS